MHQKVVLGQEASEEHLVPLFIGALAVEAIHVLLTVALPLVAKLPGLGPKLDPQGSLVRCHVAERFGVIDGQPPQCRPGPFFGLVAGIDNHPFQLVPQLCA